MKRYLLPVMLFLLLSAGVAQQGIVVTPGSGGKGIAIAPGSGGTGVSIIPGGASGGTLSFVQAAGCATSSAYSCNLTLTSDLTAGNLYFYASDGGEAYEGIMSPGFVSGTQTYLLGTSAGSNTLLEGVGCSNGVDTQTWLPRCRYILPPYTNGSTSTTVTAYFTAPTAGSPTSGTCTVGETLTQATSGATGVLWQAYSTIPQLTGLLVMYKITGTPTATNVWTGGTSGCTYTPTAVPDKSSGHAWLAEFHPSANGSQVGVDNDTGQWLNTASTSLTGPAITTSGTSPVICGVIFGDTSNITISTVSSPYSGTGQNYHAGNQEGFACAQTTSPPTWTVSSSLTAVTRGMAFSYNPTAFTEASFLNFNGCTSGSGLTVACIQSSVTGWAPPVWTDDGPNTGMMTANTSAALTAAMLPGRLGDGSTPSASTLGAVFTGNGSGSDRWKLNTGNSYASNFSSVGSTNLVWAIQWNNVCTGGTEFPSVISNRSQNDNDWNDTYFGAEGGGTCQFKAGSSAGTSSPSGAFIQNETYIGDAHFSNSSGANSTSKFYTITAITGASCTSGTTTITTAGLPADGNITTGKSVNIVGVNPSAWNGFFTSITVSGNNVSYSQTCPGSAYSSGGYILAQVGSTANLTATGINWGMYLFGTSSSTLSSGYTIYSNYYTLYLGTDPLQ